METLLNKLPKPLGSSLFFAVLDIFFIFVTRIITDVSLEDRRPRLCSSSYGANLLDEYTTTSKRSYTYGHFLLCQLLNWPPGLKVSQLHDTMVKRRHFVLRVLTALVLVRDTGTCNTSIKMARDEWKVGKGQNFTLSCSVVCLQPSHRLQWLHNTTVVLETDSGDKSAPADRTVPFHVREAAMRDSGTYYCRTSPEMASSNNVFITVVDLVVTVSSVSVEVCEGGTVKLNCTATSPLDISLFWTRGGCEGNRTLGNGTLLLSPVIPHDSGDYYCCASISTRIPLRRSRKVQVKVLGE
ncbi:synaptogenesis protein syg-1-like [Arapaima gigas]